jgi:hypothetical protein
VLAAATSIPLAFRERATADFLTSLANDAWSHEAARATLDQASGYDTAFWFGIALAGLSALIAVGLLRRAGQTMYGAAALVAALSAASGAWGLLGTRPEVGGTALAVVAATLTAAATVALVGSLLGLAATEPMEPRVPLRAPVPPSHQAG